MITHFSQDSNLLNIQTQKWHFSKHKQENIKFVRDLSLSQQHTLARFWNWFFLLDTNRHSNGLIGETMNKKLKLTSKKHHVTQNPSTFIYSHNVNNISR